MLLSLLLAANALAAPQGLLQPSTAVRTAREGERLFRAAGEPLPVELLEEVAGGWRIRTITTEPACHPVAHEQIAFTGWVPADALMPVLVEETILTWKGGSAHLTPGQALLDLGEGRYLAPATGLVVEVNLPEKAVATQLSEAQLLTEQPEQTLYTVAEHTAHNNGHRVRLMKGAAHSSTESGVQATRACMNLRSDLPLQTPATTRAWGTSSGPAPVTTTLGVDTALLWPSAESAGTVAQELRIDATTVSDQGCFPLIANLQGYPHDLCATALNASAPTPGIVSLPEVAWPSPADPAWSYPPVYHCDVSLTVSGDGALQDFTATACDEPFFRAAQAAYGRSATFKGRTAAGASEPVGWTEKHTVHFVLGRDVKDPAPNNGLRTDRVTVHHSELDVKRRTFPVYPEHLQGQHLEPVLCYARIHINQSGVPTSVVIEQPYNDCTEAFQTPAIESLMKWRWYPPKVNGEKADVEIRLGITFVGS